MRLSPVERPTRTAAFGFQTGGCTSFTRACHRRVLTELVNQYNPCIKHSRLLGWWPRTVRALASPASNCLQCSCHHQPDSPRALGSGAQEDSLRSSSKHPLALLAGTSLRASLTSLGSVLASAAVAERTAPVNPPRREPHTSPAYCASRRSLRSLLRCSSLAAGPRFTACCARRSASRPLSGRPRTARRRGRTRPAVGRERVPSEREVDRKETSNSERGTK